ncbi:MAG: DUF1738 domain-containing protein [Alphaproteobacteria bacterium]|nr:DUF1738 domain-containing protein [Alphaproteobacteria bacterium]
MQEHRQKRASIYREITDKIVAMIEAGPGIFKAPWHLPPGMAIHPTNASTHAEYRGINVLGLWIEATLKNYVSNLWASYRQWGSMGAQVRKGEKGALVVFYKRIEATAPDETDHERTGTLRYVARASYVFNADQVDGYTPAPAPIATFNQIEEVEAFVEAIDARIDHGHPLAKYRRVEDRIEMPDRTWFVGSNGHTAEQSYYAVLLHELIHWTGAEHRLNRVFGARYGDHAYAFEELVAELGAAFMCAAFGVATEPRPDHAAYVKEWLSVLKDDPRAIFTAAREAQSAFEYLSYLATRNDAGQPSKDA